MAEMNISEQIVEWMHEHGLATGHGDTIADMLNEAKWQIAEQVRRETVERCAKVADYQIELCKAAQNSEEPDEIDKYGISVAEDIASAIRATAEE
jgi:hypothetical protein